MPKNPETPRGEARNISEVLDQDLIESKRGEIEGLLAEYEEVQSEDQDFADWVKSVKREIYKEGKVDNEAWRELPKEEQTLFNKTVKLVNEIREENQAATGASIKEAKNAIYAYISHLEGRGNNTQSEQASQPSETASMSEAEAEESIETERQRVLQLEQEWQELSEEHNIAEKHPQLEELTTLTIKVIKKRVLPYLESVKRADQPTPEERDEYVKDRMNFWYAHFIRFPNSSRYPANKLLSMLEENPQTNKEAVDCAKQIAEHNLELIDEMQQILSEKFKFKEIEIKPGKQGFSGDSKKLELYDYEYIDDPEKHMLIAAPPIEAGATYINSQGEEEVYKKAKVLVYRTRGLGRQAANRLKAEREKDKTIEYP